MIQRQKETTGRVVFWNMGMINSYTMEASYGGTNMGSRAFTHFTTDDYEGVISVPFIPKDFVIWSVCTPDLIASLTREEIPFSDLQLFRDNSSPF